MQRWSVSIWRAKSKTKIAEFSMRCHAELFAFGDLFIQSPTSRSVKFNSNNNGDQVEWREENERKISWKNIFPQSHKLSAHLTRLSCSEILFKYLSSLKFHEESFEWAIHYHFWYTTLSGRGVDNSPAALLFAVVAENDGVGDAAWNMALLITFKDRTAAYR